MAEVLSGFETIERFHKFLYGADELKKIKAHPCNESLVKLLTHPKHGESTPSFEIEIDFHISEHEIQLVFVDRVEVIELKPK